MLQARSRANQPLPGLQHQSLFTIGKLGSTIATYGNDVRQFEANKTSNTSRPIAGPVLAGPTRQRGAPSMSFAGVA